MAKVAWIGLGVMGYPMAGHLRKKGGHDLTVYNRNGAKADAWVKEYGGKTAPTPADAAKDQDFVFCCVGNDNDLRDVTLGAKGAFSRVRKGAVFVDNTTASANIARELYAAAKAKGFDFLDAPVSGGQAGARERRADRDDRRRPGALRQGQAGDGQLRAHGHADRAVRLRPAHQDGQPGHRRHHRAGRVRGARLRAEGRPRHPQGDGDHLQGRGPVLADGEPLEDHERGQVRVRLRRRLDAQGPRHHHGRGQAQRRQACRWRP